METRSQRGETIDAIQERLSLANISEQVSEHVNQAVETAKVAVYKATIGKAATFMKNLSSEVSHSSIVATAKKNPLPFILIGVGAGMLVYNTYSAKDSYSSGARRLSARRDELSEGESSSALGTVREKIGGLTDSVSSTAGTAYDKVSDVADRAYSGAGEYVSQAYNKVGELGTTAKGQYDHYIEENPLAVGAVALALGAAVGMAIPSTRYEGQLMGNARQGLLEKAQDTATGLLDKTKQVVSEAGKTVADQTQSMIEH